MVAFFKFILNWRSRQRVKKQLEKWLNNNAVIKARDVIPSYNDEIIDAHMNKLRERVKSLGLENFKQIGKRGFLKMDKLAEKFIRAIIEDFSIETRRKCMCDTCISEKLRTHINILKLADKLDGKDVDGFDLPEELAEKYGLMDHTLKTNNKRMVH